MNRETIAGAATVKLLCVTFGLSRAAYYDAKREPVRVAKVARLCVRPDVAPAALVLEKIRLIIGENAAWGVRKVWATLRREHGARLAHRPIATAFEALTSDPARGLADLPRVMRELDLFRALPSSREPLRAARAQAG